jgi:tRNA threonylcarbamoyladenosine modification (KEOPS) complex  Pcc1 subunit
MQCRCSLEFEYDIEDLAISIARAVEADNQGFVNMRVEGSKIVAEIEVASPSSLLHTIDDLLVCISAAEGVLGLGQ